MRAWWVVLAAACGDNTVPETPDAKMMIDAAPTGTALTHRVFIESEGLTLMKGSAEDATANTSALPTSTATLKPYLMADAQREAKIAAIVQEYETILAPYGVFVTRTRPAQGPYDMMVLTDDSSAAIGFGQGISSITSTGCNMTPSPIGIVFGGFDPHFVTSMLVSMLGLAAGIPSSDKSGDCMCYSGTHCGPLTAPCTIGGAGTQVAAMPGCGSGSGTMDEQGLFQGAFGPR